MEERMMRTSLLAAVAFTVRTGTAWAETWTGGDDLPTNPLACDATPAAAAAKP
jgi:rhamnose transport system substrate-binding protein